MSRPPAPGSEDLINAIFRAVLREGDEVVTICPSFGLHEFGAQAVGATVRKVVFNPDWTFPVEAMLCAMGAKTRILIFSSPSNPVGPAISRDEFARLIAGLSRHVLVVFDEAYREYRASGALFDAPAMMRAAGLNWISLRTFSKAYGLAGARVGYGTCCDPALARALRKTRNPFAVNALAGAAALEALRDSDHLDRNVALTVAERDRVAQAMRTAGYDIAPSEGNFLFFRTVGKAADFAEALRRQGILIKAWQEEPFLDWARVTIATPDENDIFLEAAKLMATSG